MTPLIYVNQLVNWKITSWWLECSFTLWAYGYSCTIYLDSLTLSNKLQEWFLLMCLGAIKTQDYNIKH